MPKLSQLAVSQVQSNDLLLALRGTSDIMVPASSVPGLFGVSVLTGADPTGLTDSSAAILAATKSNTLLLFPQGLYKITNLLINNVNNCTWLGCGVGGVGFTTSQAGGAMLTWGANCNFNVIDGFSFSPTGVLASTVGALFNWNNSTLRNCVFQLWTNAGAKLVGTVGTPLSGNKIYDCYFLQNASVAGVGQLDMLNCNDYFLTHNQFGIINTGIFGFPSYGVQAQNTSNGQFDSNFIWQNMQGANFVNCKYDRLFSNRFEQSQKEGAIFNACLVPMFNNNWLNNNGNLATNTYNDMRWIGCSGMTIQGNQGYDWLGGVPQTKYFCSLEASCLRFSIKGNVANPAPSGYAGAAWFWDATIPDTTNTTDGSLHFSSGPTIAAGSATFLGKGASNASFSAVADFCDATHTMVQLTVECTAAPGAGQSFTYTLFKNNVATGLVAVISGAAQFQAFLNASTTIEDVANDSSYSVQVVTSAGAAAANHFAQAIYCGK